MKRNLITFTKWCLKKEDRTLGSINPVEVSDIEDYCGSVNPGSMITLKNKKTFLVWGDHNVIVEMLRVED